MPTISAGPVTFNIPHDQILNVGSGGVLANASTDTGNTLSAVLISGPADGTINFPGDGSFTYTGAAGFVGTDSIVFEAFDGVDYSDPTTATINVTDNPPQLQVNTPNLVRNQDFNGIFATFTDTDNPNGPFAATINFGDGQSASATVATDPNGGYDVIADHTYAATGIYTVSVTVTDPLGISSAASANLSVVPAVTANPAAFNISHDQTLTVASPGLLAGASDVSGNPLTALLVSGPSDGTVSFPGDGSFVYTPNAGFVGSDAIVFEAFDGTNYSDPTTVTINVTDPPAQIQSGNFTDLTGDGLLRPFAYFTDTDNPNATFTTAIDYGDGQTDAGSVVPEGTGNYILASNHVYSTPGTYTVAVTITDPLGVSASASFTVTVLSQYDSTYTDPDGNETQFIYTGNWQITQEIDPLGNSTYFTYTSAGQLASSTDALSREIEYGYDSAGDLTSEIWLNADGSTADTLNFTYDSTGDLLSASNGSGTYTFSYNSQGQLADVTEPFGVSLTFGYDSAGNRTSVADSFGGLTTSVYDSSNKLVSRSFTDGQNTLDVGLSYNSDGTLAAIDRYSDLAGTQLVAATGYTYSQGEIASITDTDANDDPIDAFTYQLAANGLVASATSAIGGTSNYTYDAGGQLTSDGSNTYSYDANGNRNMAGYVVGPDNELLSDGTWNYAYDMVGNLIGKVNIATGETWTYAYDDMNHMTQASQYAAAGALLMQANYKYDAFGNRIEKDVWTPAQGLVVTEYALDGWNTGKAIAVGNANWDVWAEMNGNGSLTTRYINGDALNQVFARIDANGVAWLLTDNLGSVRDVVSNTGALLDHIDYGAFGNITYQLNAAYGGNILFTGDQFDAETGLYFSRARYLDPFTARWTTQDPIGLDAGDSNLYRYVGNGPTNSSDPSGMWNLWNWLANDVIGTDNVNSWNSALGQKDIGWFAESSNFGAGWGDVCSLGATLAIRQLADYDTVNHDSGWYWSGAVAGFINTLLISKNENPNLPRNPRPNVPPLPGFRWVLVDGVWMGVRI